MCVCVCTRKSLSLSLSLSLSRIDTLTGALERPSNYHSTSIYSIYKHSFLPEDVILFHNWIKSMHSSWKRQQKYFQWIFQLQSQKCRLTKKCSGAGVGGIMDTKRLFTRIHVKVKVLQAYLCFLQA